jgi:hypothetical protein
MTTNAILLLAAFSFVLWAKNNTPESLFVTYFLGSLARIMTAFCQVHAVRPADAPTVTMVISWAYRKLASMVLGRCARKIRPIQYDPSASSHVNSVEESILGTLGLPDNFNLAMRLEDRAGDVAVNWKKSFATSAESEGSVDPAKKSLRHMPLYGAPEIDRQVVP